MHRVAAALGFLAVALGAFGAHALRPVLAAHGTAEVWQTAVLYHLVHAAVLLFVSRLDPAPRFAAAAFALGIVLFSGSLYLLALTGLRWPGALAPVGGACLLAGWLLLAIGRPRR